jgi:hypothetical protein
MTTENVAHFSRIVTVRDVESLSKFLLLLKETPKSFIPPLITFGKMLVKTVEQIMYREHMTFRNIYR